MSAVRRSISSCLSTNKDSRQEIATAAIVTSAAPARPICLPASPARSAAISGSIGIASNSVGFISALQAVEFFDADGAPLAEQHHEDREPDGRFRGRHGQHEEHEDLPVQLAQVAREGDEIEVCGQQQQLDAHEQKYDVLAVEEYAGHRQREQYRRERQHVAERDHLRCSESILMIRTRSLARAAPCLPMFCTFSPGRWRSVSVIAATIATSSSIAAISSG